MEAISKRASGVTNTASQQ